MEEIYWGTCVNIGKIKDKLDDIAYFATNDSETREKVEKLIKGVICNEEVNTPDIIDRNCLRLKINGVMYEYRSFGHKLYPNTELVKVKE